tara:strand:+ start:190 stop:828 length:639 start_codon:yes stop_codon:yes gene_type:complete
VTPRVLMIDNYDSFTFNLVQYMLAQGAEVVTKRNDAMTADDAAAFEPTHLVISPGPGRPEDAGNMMAIVEKMMDRAPMLGVCLGHQAIAQVLGAPVRHATRLMHGKSSPMTHDGLGVYRGIPSPCEIGRYHSLSVREDELPTDLTPTSHASDDGELMGFRHRSLPVEGVQFHPESVLTLDGYRMMANFIGIELPDDFVSPIALPNQEPAESA